jgi:chromate transporter
VAGKSVCAISLHGAVAAAVAITVKTVWTISKPHFKGRERIRVIIVGATALALYVVAGLSAIEVLLIAAAVGALWPAEHR